MYAVDEDFLAALGGYRELVTELTVTPPGGSTVELEVKSARLSVDGSLARRRSVSGALVATAAEYRVLCTPGATVRVRHGYMDSGLPRLIPVFTGEVGRAVRNIVEGSASCTFVDWADRLARARFLSPFQTSPLLTRVEQIAALVTDAIPVTVQNLAGGAPLLAGGASWDEDRAAAIKTLLADGPLEGFFSPGGTYVIRRPATPSTPSVWTIAPGDAGTLKSAMREVPLDRLYNTVVVRPSATDGSQTWAPQVAQITDAADPRHPSKVGVVVLTVDSPTAASAEQAMAIAQAKLLQQSGRAETLQLDVIGNPALDAGDVVRVITPQVGEDPAVAVTHVVDGFDLDLSTGSMSLRTRSFDA